MLLIGKNRRLLINKVSILRECEIRGDFMAKDRRANAVVFGFDFQVNAAIVLMLENIEDFKSLRLEGNYEDIELELTSNQYILAQAKAVERASLDFNNVRTNLQKSLTTLSEGEKKVDAQKLILITNSSNPLKENESKNLFTYDAHRDFFSLPDSSQQIIQEYLKGINKPLDLSKFMIQVLPFETDNERERYKIVRRCIDDFVGNLKLNIPGLSKRLMDLWQNEVFINGTKKDAEIKLLKSDIVWPIMVIATDVEYCGDSLRDRLDLSTYDEIVHQYKSTIDSHCERCEFFTKVLSDYNTFVCTKKPSEKSLAFVIEKWESYLPDFQVDNIEAETLQGLIQIILYNIVRNRITIDRIKREVKL